MEIVSFVRGHFTADALEEYAFNRLSERETEHVEEHVLACRECQASLAEVDEYILLMKQATAAYQPAILRRINGNAPRVGNSGRLKNGARYAGGAMSLAAIAFVALAWRSDRLPSEVSVVPLIALRGGGPSINHAYAGRPLELAIDTAGLAPAGGLATAAAYRVNVVDAAGNPVWSGSLPARVARGLKPGMYWVRLYAGEELLREFGLLASR